MRYKKLTAAASDIDDFPPSEAEINDYEANEELADGIFIYVVYITVHDLFPTV